MSMNAPNDPIAHMRILTMKHVCEITSYTAQHIYRLIRAGKFPRPIRLGLNRIGFRMADIEKWMADRPLALPAPDEFGDHLNP
ncbi:MAG: helix-turn-helix transcriptional regulator [Hyphomicrobiaceae bacterium]